MIMRTNKTKTGVMAIVLISAIVLGVWALAKNQPVADKELKLADIQTQDNTRTDTQIEQLKGRLEENPDNVDLYNRLGVALIQKGRETGDLSWYNRAREAFQKAVDLDPKNSISLYNLAWAYTIHHHFQKAIRYAQQAIEIDPNSYPAYGVLSDSYVELGDYEKGLEYAQKMLDLHPDLASYSRGAHLRWLQGNVKGAVLLFQKAIEAGGPYPEHTAWARTQLADIYFKTGNIRAAEQVYKQVLQDLPDYRHALMGIGRVHITRKKLEEAVRMFEKATAGMPPIAYVVELGDLYTLKGDKQKAEAEYAKVDSMVDEHLKYDVEGNELVQAIYHLDHDRDLTKALRLAESEIKEHKSVQAYTTLAWAYYKHKRYTDAEKAIKQAMRLNTQDPLLLYRAGKIYQAMGQASLAKRYLFAAVSLNPSFHSLFAQDAYHSLYSHVAKK
jgi:tetratricopeptide (TPR) repeat protein